MSFLGRFLLNACDTNLMIDFSLYPNILSQFNASRLNIESYARGLGLTIRGLRHTAPGIPILLPIER